MNHPPKMPEQVEQITPTLVAEPAEAAPQPITNNAQGDDFNWHVEAGRKGGRRVHQLMQLGLLYEKEHGLKRGRQRVRQLIQEGKLYEQEHGLSGTPRRHRLGREQLVQQFLRALARMVKPSFRAKVTALLGELDNARPS
jgi:hypothetical protein